MVGSEFVVIGAVRSAGLREAADFLDDAGGWRERVFRVDEHVSCVACGVVPDAKQLLRALQRLASDHRRTWGTRIPVGVVAARLGDLAHGATLRTGNRPFGAAFILAGYDDDAQRFRLFVTDPAGFADEFDTSALLGRVPTEVRKEALSDGPPTHLRDASRQVTKLLVHSLRTDAKNEAPQIRPLDLEFACLFLRPDGSVASDILNTTSIADLLKEHNDTETNITTAASDDAEALSPPR